MQPRREGVERPGERVFQVTNNGDSVIVEERWEVRCGFKPTGEKALVLEEGVVFAVEGEMGEEELDAGVEEPL